MATYTELRDLFSDGDLQNKVAVAVAIAANKTLTGEDNVAPFSQVAGAHDLRVVWAKDVFGKAETYTAQFWQRMIADNESASVAAITGATDATIQGNVDAAVDLFAGVAV